MPWKARRQHDKAHRASDAVDWQAFAATKPAPKVARSWSDRLTVASHVVLHPARLTGESAAIPRTQPAATARNRTGA